VELASHLGAHHKHRGVLGEDEDGPEGPDHGEAVVAVLCSAVRKTVACEKAQTASASASGLRRCESARWS
jgi:hypothetical protein